MNLANCCRVSFFRNLACPAIEAACSWKTFLAKSTPNHCIFIMIAVLSGQWL
jgi:hypothetical protein